MLARGSPGSRGARPGVKPVLFPHPEEPRLRRVSKDEAHRGLMVRDGARAPPHHEDKNYAPIAILGSASALAFISFRARRYSTGITLRNFGSHVFQSARISAARLEPASLAWRVIRMCSRSISDSRRLPNTSTLPCASRSPLA